MSEENKNMESPPSKCTRIFGPDAPRSPSAPPTPASVYRDDKL